jgi:hypothetical protein
MHTIAARLHTIADRSGSNVAKIFSPTFGEMTRANDRNEISAPCGPPIAASSSAAAHFCEAASKTAGNTGDWP